MGILFVVFALVIVIVSGIPMAKKKLEENKKFKEYTENTQLGKNEIVGKIKDERTVNDKFISAMFYVGIVVLDLLLIMEMRIRNFQEKIRVLL